MSACNQDAVCNSDMSKAAKESKTNTNKTILLIKKKDTIEKLKFPLANKIITNSKRTLFKILKENKELPKIQFIGRGYKMRILDVIDKEEIEKKDRLLITYKNICFIPKFLIKVESIEAIKFIKDLKDVIIEIDSVDCYSYILRREIDVCIILYETELSDDCDEDLMIYKDAVFFKCLIEKDEKENDEKVKVLKYCEDYEEEEKEEIQQR